MKKTWRIIELLNWGDEYLKNKGIEQPRLHMEHLLSHTLNKKRINIYLSYDEVVPEEKLIILKEYIKRITSHEPLMYILGETEFYGCKIKVNSKVLIPRSETELMLDEIVLTFKKRKPPLQILDLGSGSGCISIALASRFKDSVITSVDISEDALKIAGENASLNNISENLNFIREDMLLFKTHGTKYDLIVSNPPYIALSDYLKLDKSVKDYEPRSALTDEADGKKYLKHIILNLPDFLNEGGFAFLEFGINMHDWIRSLIQQQGYEAKLFKDYQNLFRFVKIYKNQVSENDKTSN